jgi:hypothetical protein
MITVIIIMFINCHAYFRDYCEGGISATANQACAGQLTVMRSFGEYMLFALLYSLPQLIRRAQIRLQLCVLLGNMGYKRYCIICHSQ